MAAAASTAREASALGDAHFTPAEVDLRGVHGGGLVDETPAARPSWARRTRAAFRGSVWAPVALKLLGLALGMLALAGVGIASILSGVGGVPVPLPGMMSNDINKAWLSSKPAGAGAGAGASAGASAGAPSAAPVSGSSATAGDSAAAVLADHELNEH